MLGSNLIPNPLFENRTGNNFDLWDEIQGGTGTITAETVDVPTGYTVAARFDIDASNTNCYVRQTGSPVRYEFGTGGVAVFSMLYKATASNNVKIWIRADDGAGGSSQSLSDNGTTWQDAGADWDPVLTVGAWSTLTLELPPTNPGRTHIHVQSIGRGFAASQTFFVTDVSLKKLTFGEKALGSPFKSPFGSHFKPPIG